MHPRRTAFDSEETHMDATPAKPQVDRRQLQHIVAGLTEGILIIDPEGSIVWANETALSIHGCTQLEEIGANAAEYRRKFVLKFRNHHALSAKQYPIERVLAGQTFRDVIVNVTRKDDADFRRVHQVRGLILTNASDEVESLVLVVQDVSERYSAEERFERTFNVNPAPAVICRLADLRYIKVNSGFLEMSGYERDAVLAASIYQIDVLEGTPNRDDAVAKLQRGESITQTEAMLRLPGDARKFVIVAGQPIEVGEEACMLFTFIDLAARKKAEDALRQSEERFSKAFLLAPVPMVLCRLPDFDFVETNEAFKQTFSDISMQRPDEERSDDELKAGLHEAAGKNLAAGENVRNRGIVLRGPDDTRLDCLLSAEAVEIGDERYALCVVEDVTERKRSEAELIAAIETVMKDASWFGRSVIERLAQLRHPGSGAPANLADLTQRETQVLGLICEGRSDSEIAAVFGLSRNTVRNHVATLYSKIGVNRRSAAVVWGRERGITGSAVATKGGTRASRRSR
jgi:PAS domain S-box-containing protein